MTSHDSPKPTNPWCVSFSRVMTHHESSATTHDARRVIARAPIHSFARAPPRERPRVMDAFDRVMTARSVAADARSVDANATLRRRIESNRARAAASDDASDATPTPLVRRARDEDGDRDTDDDAREREREDEEVVRYVLEKYAAKEYFACLNLPKPDCDDAGRPTWTTTDAELNRAFRKASLRVHPDKNSCVDARKAFDAIGETQKLFKDPARRAEALRTAAEAAFKEKCKRDPELMRKRIKAQEKVDAASYAEDMKRQRDEQRKRAAEAREKSAEATRRRRVRVRDDDEEEALATMARNLEAEEEAATKEKERANGDESDDDGFAGVVKKRKAKRFMF